MRMLGQPVLADTTAAGGIGRIRHECVGAGVGDAFAQAMMPPMKYSAKSAGAAVASDGSCRLPATGARRPEPLSPWKGLGFQVAVLP
jgi:hypothetical protein